MHIDYWLKNFLDSIKSKFGKKPLNSLTKNMALNQSISRAEKLKLIKNIITEIKSIDKNKSKEILKECGEKCINQSILNQIIKEKDKYENLEHLLNALNSYGVGGGNLYLAEGNKIFGSYKKCGCFISEIDRDIHLCNCSKGWLMKLFETILEKEVKVEILQSIIGGGKTCEFIIHL